MYCKKCGNQLEEDIVFCPKCGQGIAEKVQGSTTGK